jgi:hypothetical protein
MGRATLALVLRRSKYLLLMVMLFFVVNITHRA